ncbi:MAG: TetR/AcrR family transcriptional regulator [Acidobacteria bacterium]|nr:TetR/AcrR family transcriptional regulator [Acidobacteriota bacterium]
MAKTRTRILNAAKAIHRRTGVDGLSMRRIAAKLGVTAPAIYHHFRNRDALLEAVSDEGFERLVARLGRLSSARPSLQQCLDVLIVYREFALNEPHVFAIMFMTPRPRTRQFPDDFRARRSAAFSLLADRVAAAMAARALREDDPNEVALTLWAHAHGLVLLQRGGRFGEQLAPYRRVFDRSLGRLMAGITAH